VRCLGTSSWRGGNWGLSQPREARSNRTSTWMVMVEMQRRKVGGWKGCRGGMAVIGGCHNLWEARSNCILTWMVMVEVQCRKVGEVLHEMPGD